MTERQAKEVIRTYQVRLRDAIVNTGLKDVLDCCEAENLITSPVKSKLADDLIGKPTSDRASDLIDNIKRSLTFSPDSTLDSFLCILYDKSVGDGKELCIRIATDCKSNV